MVPIVVAAVLAFAVGSYVRAFAAAFEPDPPDTRAEARRAYLSRPRPAWPPYLELATSAAVALLCWRAGPQYAFFAVLAVTLSLIDWRTYRLPDAITLPAYPVLALTLWPDLPRALLGALALALLYGLLWFARPAAMGFGDVKLAGLVGMAAAAAGWQQWVLAALAGQFAAALYAAWLLAGRKGSGQTQFPLGPFMLAGAFATLCLTS
ncbi:A24 family peptidase [Nonomuraea longicatena]|uniref:Prepilin type IV endopeptidase peptidase domain-containing protein n=1 Tax=Nonomuraea longicatena TaxID=83682 RepID=A0ABP3Z1J7_9ACTN